ncbi:hypothetical protein PInf_006096 [Phytophthora infestans]|nr:hypothetical protein PInf_006096 [Phytophthora infestans]
MTAVEDMVERETPTVRDTIETVEDAKRLVVERKAAEVCGTTEVFAAETKAMEVEMTRDDENITAEKYSTDCVATVTEGTDPVEEEEEKVCDTLESVSDGESEESVGEAEATEASLTTVAVTIEPTARAEEPRSPTAHEPRLGAKPPLKSALKKPLATVVDWRPSEDAEIGVGETVYAALTLKDDPKETVVKAVAQEIVEEAVGGEAATVPDHGDVGIDLCMVEKAPEAKYFRLYSDLDLKAMEGGGTGEEYTVLAVVKVTSEREEYDKELEERLGPQDEVELTRQMKVNAETSKDPSLENMAEYLGIPEDVLERVSEPSSSKLKRPEYWQEWFNETLESSAEAKRANRDFSSSSTEITVSAPQRTSGKVGVPDNPVSENTEAKNYPLAGDARVNPMMESLVCENVAFLLEAENMMVTATEVQPCHFPFGRRAFRRGMVRSVAREAVYQMLEEMKECPAEEDSVPVGEAFEVQRIEASSCAYTGMWNDSFKRRCSSLHKDSAEALNDLKFRLEGGEDASHYVQVMFPERPPPDPPPNRGLKTVTFELSDGFGVHDNEDEERPSMTRVVQGGRRVVCAVGSFEALSGGYIDCLPSQMLADTGATLNRIDRRFQKRLERYSEFLQLYDEVSVKMVVADKLHVDAILGVDALGVFGALIDVRTLTLKDTSEVLQLEMTVVHDTNMAPMASSVRLPPRGQGLVVANFVGNVRVNDIVLVEGAVELPPTLGIARSLCTVGEHKVIVEVCNASTDEYWIQKGTVVASASILPRSAFNYEDPRGEEERQGKNVPSEDVERSVTMSVTEGQGEGVCGEARASKPDVPPDKDVDATADFSKSDLSAEQKTLFRSELNGFYDMFVESSMKLRRTEILYFKVDTGNIPPIKQQPYLVSLAEGEVMEAEIQQ